MDVEVQERTRARAVVVVGVDLNDSSEHLWATARDLVCSYSDMELHVVHVVAHERLPKRLVRAPDLRRAKDALASGEAVKERVERLCREISLRKGARLVIHTPVGDASRELIRVAREVGADVIVLEAPDRSEARSIFARSAVGRIATAAPCSVLTVRSRLKSPQPQPETAPLTVEGLAVSVR